MEQPKTNYDKFPQVGAEGSCEVGWPDVVKTLRARQARVVVVECYPGVRDAELLPALVDGLKPERVINTADCLKPEGAIARLVCPDVTEDPVFGYLTRLSMEDFFDAAKMAQARAQCPEARSEAGSVLVYHN